MLFVIDFALAAPVVVQKREVHVSRADEMIDTSPLGRDPSSKWLANTVDRANTLLILRSSDSGHWLEQEPRQHNPIDSNDPPEGSGGPKPLPLWDLNDSPPPSPTDQPPTNQLPTGEPSTSQHSTSELPTSQPPASEHPTDEPHPLNPSSTSGDIDLNHPLQDQGATDDSHALSPSSPHGNEDINPPSHLAQGPTDDSQWHVLNPALTTDPLSGLLQSPPHETLPPHDQGATDGFHALSPSSPHGNADLNPPSYLAQGPTDDSHWDVLNPTDSLSGLLQSPPHETLLPHDQGATDDSHALNPSSPHSNTDLYLPSYQAQGPAYDSHMFNPSLPHGNPALYLPSYQAEGPTYGSHVLDPSSSHGVTDLNPPYYPAQGPTDDSHVSNPAPASSSDSGSFLSGLLQSPAHDTMPGGSPQMESSPDSGGSHPPSPFSQQQLSTDGFHLPTSGPTDNSPASPSNSGPHPLLSAESQNEDSWMTELEILLKSPYLDENQPLSLGADHPLGPAPTDNPPQASPPNPGPSTEPNPPPSEKRPRPEDDEPGSSLSKIFKGKFKRLFSGSGSLNAAQGEFQSTFKSSAYVTAFSLPCQQTAVITNIVTIGNCCSPTTYAISGVIGRDAGTR